MTIDQDLLRLLEERIDRAFQRYGNFASTHEALGVALEEWNELQLAIHDNDLTQTQHECIDLAAVLIRLALSLEHSQLTRQRSVK